MVVLGLKICSVPKHCTCTIKRRAHQAPPPLPRPRRPGQAGRCRLRAHGRGQAGVPAHAEGEGRDQHRDGECCTGRPLPQDRHQVCHRVRYAPEPPGWGPGEGAPTGVQGLPDPPPEVGGQVHQREAEQWPLLKTK